MTGSTSPMKSIQRTSEIVDLLWKLDGAGPTKVSEEMDIPLSTAHVYLQTLESTGYVINTNGTYSLSQEFLSMGSRIKHRNKLFQIAQPSLRELAEVTGELVLLIIEEAGRAVILHKEEGENAIDLGIYSGLKLPIHTHASGKAILAKLSRDRVDEIIGMHGLSSTTSETITDRGVLFDELEKIDKDDYAVEHNQQIMGMGTIGVPVVVEGSVKGCIGLGCPTERLRDDEYQQTLLRKMRETNEEITLRYQFGN